MASPSTPSASPSGAHRAPTRPNTAFRELRGARSPGEFAAAVRRAAREIGEQVSCDARYVGRVESGEIRCPNYAYERVFRHMFPGLSLQDMGFLPRERVRGRAAHPGAATAPVPPGGDPGSVPESPLRRPPSGLRTGDGAPPLTAPPRWPTPHPGVTRHHIHEESDVLRRAFITGGPAAALGAGGLPGPAHLPGPRRESGPHRAGRREAAAVEEAVRNIRLLDDRHGAERLYEQATGRLRAAYELLDAGAQRQAVNDRLHNGAGELAISVGWLAHDSGRFDAARSHYGEALATARMSGDDALEAHAFCNTAFLARDAGRPREAVRASQAAQRAARRLGSARLMSLLSLREAGGWAGLADRGGCEQSLARSCRFFAQGPSEADPEWMSFFGEAELEGLQAQCWAALGRYERAARHARRAVELQNPHFTRNIALFTAELAGDLAGSGSPVEAAVAGSRVLSLLDRVQSARIRSMVAGTAQALRPHRRDSPEVAWFLERHAALTRTA
ncbi:tetratricopeptide repeat protein [Streptomyces sp. NPDC059740]|uniref:tetratricopeptide repeat protein n=1 Tax=Streptomyces sp. NPDC059740 TaxID=3346926 RepID=UPI00364A0B6B